MKKSFTLNVDGVRHTIDADPAMPLLYALRNDLEKKGPRFGCGLAQCGACTVIHDGVALRSCVVPVGSVQGAIRTLDGLGPVAAPHPLLAAFIAEEAGQCGSCLSGWIVTAAVLLEEYPHPSDDAFQMALAGL
jgi:aerobic-type carbon monoxide dehydrogenase small subunit (CoxS/CutS family)